MQGFNEAMKGGEKSVRNERGIRARGVSNAYKVQMAGKDMEPRNFVAVQSWGYRQRKKRGESQQIRWTHQLLNRIHQLAKKNKTRLEMAEAMSTELDRDVSRDPIRYALSRGSCAKDGQAKTPWSKEEKPFYWKRQI
ncbi:unnamed protein product [Phytophthora lilii]|uniref:Unnamed protein product n=1 Tax=Phytophthora lilii TaxID=2077276 RepID=A0A9W6TYP2_9STRA|nr:unnamed protein product [Phytophthora lilii]